MVIVSFDWFLVSLFLAVDLLRLFVLFRSPLYENHVQRYEIICFYGIVYMVMDDVLVLLKFVFLDLQFE